MPAVSSFFYSDKSTAQPVADLHPLEDVAVDPTATSARVSSRPMPHLAPVSAQQQSIYHYNTTNTAAVNPPSATNTTSANGNTTEKPGVSASANNAPYNPLLQITPNQISQLSEDERNRLRQQLLEEINATAAVYARRSLFWTIFYYVMAGLSLLGNALVLITSSSLISTALNSNSPLPSWLPLLNTVASVVSAACVAINAQLQSRMNAVYFNEAKERYLDVKTLMWVDLMKAVNELALLDQVYDKSGVGFLMNLDSLVSHSANVANGPNKKKDQKKKEQKMEQLRNRDIGGGIQLCFEDCDLDQLKQIQQKRYAYPRKF